MQVGPDPYAKQRRWWPILLRMARQLYWTWWVLAGLGLLSKSSPLTRWLERRFAEVEHGLRCLLIIKASSSRRFVPKADRSSKFETSDDAPEADDLLKQILSPRSGCRRSAFSLTLSGFDRPTQQPPPIPGYAGPVGRSSPQNGLPDHFVRSCGPATNSPVNRGREEYGALQCQRTLCPRLRGKCPKGEGGAEVIPIISPADQFAARLTAIESVFNDADGYAMRIAKRVYARGGRLIRLIAEQLTDIGFALDPGWPQSLVAGPKPVPILDSS